MPQKSIVRWNMVIGNGFRLKMSDGSILSKRLDLTECVFCIVIIKDFRSKNVMRFGNGTKQSVELDILGIKEYGK